MSDIDPQSRRDYIAHWEAKLVEAERLKEQAERALGIIAVRSAE